jgi:glyoxylase-like metal-dependent hydrolase (beta-lactamase superfamily II)
MRQVATAGDEPWSRLSPNLFLTGNTYALASRDGALLLVDPYGPRIAAQVRALQQERRLGDVERVMISHAHNDHYKGVYLLPERDSFQLWTLAQVAEPIGRPYRYLAPYLDTRPVRTDRRLNDGENVRWREYEFKIHHLPGQTEFTMGVESTIDGKRCFFTADNFFHADQFSGSGGWSGRNRAWPDGYAASARQVLDAAPDWVLAEHGGAFEFNREDFARRVRWAQDAARAADRVSPSGHYRRDWDPQRVRVEPLLVSAQPGERIQMAIVAFNPTQIEETLGFELDGRGVLTGTRGEITVTAEGTARREVEVEVLRDAAPGRHVLPLVIRNGEVEDGSDTFFIVDVE